MSGVCRDAVQRTEEFSRPCSESGRQEAGPARSSERVVPSVDPGGLYPGGQLMSNGGPAAEDEEELLVTPDCRLDAGLAAAGYTVHRQPGESAISLLSPLLPSLGGGGGLLGPQSDVGRGIREIVRG